MEINESSKCILKMENIAVEEISFKRSFEAIKPGKLKFNIEAKYKDVSERNIKTMAICKIENTDKSLQLSITVSGLFSINYDIEGIDNKSILRNNTLAIIFPYLRSQVSLITAQPNLTPIVLPPVNITEFIKEEAQ